MDIDEERLDMIYKLGKRYAEQLGSKLTFDESTNRQDPLQDTAVNCGNGGASAASVSPAVSHRNESAVGRCL